MKLRISQLFEFESKNCSDCNHDNGEDKLCPILTMLGAKGECEMVWEVKDQPFCSMRDVEPRVCTESIVNWINISSTEEVSEVMNTIEESYHYDVIKGGTR